MSIFSEILIEILTCLFLFGVPAAAVVWAVVSLVKFVRTPKDSAKRGTRMVLMIVSASLAVVFLTLLGLFFYVMSQIIIHM